MTLDKKYNMQRWEEVWRVEECPKCKQKNNVRISRVVWRVEECPQLSRIIMLGYVEWYKELKNVHN